MPDRAYILCRQSLTRRDSVSLDSQEEQARAYCHQHGYSIAGVSREESIRGWRDDRDALADILTRADRREFTVLISWDQSRVARSVRILENLMHELDTRGARYESVTEAWVSAPFIRQVLAAVAEEQTRTLSKNITAAKSIAAKRGTYPGGHPPYGYDLAKFPDAPSVLVPNAREAAQVRWMFERAAAGDSARMIARTLQERQVPGKQSGTWRPALVTRILTNPVYLGHVRWHGEIVCRDARPVLVDQDLFERVQRMLAKRVSVRRQEQKPGGHWLEGRVTHACGQRMYLQVSAEPEMRSGWSRTFVCRTYYSDVSGAPHCTIARPRISAAKLSWSVRECLRADLSTVRPLPDALDHAQALAGGASVAQQRQGLDERKLAALRRYERIREAWADGNEPLEWLEEARARRDGLLAELDTALAALPIQPHPDHYKRIAAQLSEWSAVIELLPPRELRPILAELGTAVVDGAQVWIQYDAGYADFIRSPHRQPLPRGLPWNLHAAHL